MMSDQLTPSERYAILRGIDEHLDSLYHDLPLPESPLLTPEQEQFVRESIADACAAIDAAVAPVPTEEEIAKHV